MKTIQGFCSFAVRTSFSRGIHGVSLSLYHMILSADGVICRRSGISLADHRYYTAFCGQEQ
jgi:hypothetical protein